MKKGITFMALVIMVAIILTLTTTAVISGVNSIDNAKKIKFATEISYVQEIMNSYNNIGNNINFDKSYSIDVTSSSKDVIEQFSSELINNGKITLYYIDFNNENFDILNNSDLTYGTGKDDNDDIYLYSINTGKVYYKKGIKLNGNIYYTLTDELSKKIDYEFNFTNTNRDIIFLKSTDEWTNTAIKIQIKISKQYNKDSIKIYVDDDLLNVNITNETLSYYIYDFDINSNCVVRLEGKYLDDDEVIHKSYNITNIDKENPTISVGDTIKILDSDTNSLLKIIPITEKYDNESGIKVIKYEKTKIKAENIKSYFLNNGIVLNSDTITVTNDIEDITLYIEDEAGNYSYVNI